MGPGKEIQSIPSVTSSVLEMAHKIHVLQCYCTWDKIVGCLL